MQHGWNTEAGTRVAETNDFDLFIGLILARLYEERPRRLDLSAKDFGFTVEDRYSDNKIRIENWSNTMFWLE